MASCRFRPPFVAFALGVLMIAMAVGSLDAATLAPSKPSDIRVLELGEACAALGTFALDTRVNGDGTTSPFRIPDKQALILDSVTWVVNGVTTFGGLCGIVLRVGTQTIWQSGCKSSYLDPNGIPIAWPWTFDRFREEMRAPRLADFGLR